MARKLRVEYAGAIYHVMNRGDRRELIFMDDADRQRFVETLIENGLGEDFGEGLHGRRLDVHLALTDFGVNVF